MEINILNAGSSAAKKKINRNKCLKCNDVSTLNKLPSPTKAKFVIFEHAGVFDFIFCSSYGLLLTAEPNLDAK